MATSTKALDTFLWEGRDRSGNKSKGEVAAPNNAMAKALLRKQGVNATKVRKKPKPLFGERKKKITPMDIALFTRQMATMLSAGVPIVQAFDIIADGLEHPSLRDLLIIIRTDVASGSSLAASLRKHPDYFNDLYCSLIEAGEDSGTLDYIMARVATYLEKTEEIKRKVKKALTYPTAVIIVAIVVTGILLVKVIPAFEDLFSGVGAQLPALTRMVIDLSKFVQEYWLFTIVGVVISIFAFTNARKRSEKFYNAVDKMMLKIPIIGDILTKAAIARYARILSTTFAAGVPLVESLDAVAGAVGNVVYRDGVYAIRDNVTTGQQLNFAMRSTGLFPVLAVQMVSIGEESGSLDDMLDKVATHYETEVDDAVDNLTTLLEPMIMSFLGIVVGGLVIAMYMPIFSLGQAF